MRAPEFPPADARPPEPREKHCSRCDANFLCGPRAPGEQCWCDALPHIPPLAGQDRDCLCPECLRMLIAEAR